MEDWVIDLLGVCCILSAFFITTTTLRLYEKETFESCLLHKPLTFIQYSILKPLKHAIQLRRLRRRRRRRRLLCFHEGTAPRPAAADPPLAERALHLAARKVAAF